MNPAATHHQIFSVNLLPPQGEFEISLPIKDALTQTVQSLRDNTAAAILSQALLNTLLPLVNVTAAESIDLEKAVSLSLVEPIQQLFAANTSPRVHDLQRALQGLVIEQDTLRIELQEVHVDMNGAVTPAELTIDFVLQVFQLNDVDLGGDLPQNSGDGPQNALDPQAAANNFAVTLNFPLKIRIPVNVTEPETEVMVKPGQVSMDVASVNIRDFAAQIGVMPVTVADDPVILTGSLTLDFMETDANGDLTLGQLNDPFLNDAIAVTPGPSEVVGVLPIQHTICGFLEPDADPRINISSADIFNGQPAEVVPNADLEPLLVFESLTNVDVFGFLDSLTTTLNRITEAMDLPEGIPFVSSSFSSLVDVGSVIGDVVNQFTAGDEVFFQDFQSLLDAFNSIFGVTAEQLNIRCDADTNTVLMDLNLDRNVSRPVPLNFGNGLGSIDVTAGAMAELNAIVDMNLTIGFDFNASDVTEAQFLATPLDELNGHTGVDTVDGDDLEIVLPTSSFTISDEIGGPFSFKEDIEIDLEAIHQRHSAPRLPLNRTLKIRSKRSSGWWMKVFPIRFMRKPSNQKLRPLVQWTLVKHGRLAIAARRPMLRSGPGLMLQM